MELSIRIDKRSIKEFESAMQSQVPYATAVALTRTAAQAKDRVKQELRHRMIIRNQFTANSIRHIRAEKTDWPNSKAMVGSIAAYMAIQEDGGSKTPTSKAFAIPKGIRTSENRLVPRSKWPGRILGQQNAIPEGGRSRGANKGTRSKPKAFLLREHDGVGVYVRVGRGRKLKRLFRLTKETIHIKARHWLETPVTEVVQANLGNNFKRALDEALKGHK